MTKSFLYSLLACASLAAPFACSSSVEPTTTGTGGKGHGGSGGHAGHGATGGQGHGGTGGAMTSTATQNEPPCGFSGCEDATHGICDVATNMCVQCLADTDCKPFIAAGTICEPDHTCGCAMDTSCAGANAGTKCLPTSHCGCAGPEDCKGNARGPACAPKTQACGCGVDQDCVAIGSPFPRCHPNDGQCVECLTNGDCKDPDNAACYQPDGFCTQCVVDADCKASSLGKHCTQGCRCTQDNECTNSPRGPHCMQFTGIPDDACGCKSASECAASAMGKLCVPDGSPFGYASCGCMTDKDCPAATPHCSIAINKCGP